MTQDLWISSRNTQLRPAIASLGRKLLAPTPPAPQHRLTHLGQGTPRRENLNRHPADLLRRRHLRRHRLGRLRPHGTARHEPRRR